MALHTATPLTSEQLAALARLRNLPTLYEIEVQTHDGRRALVAYAARRSAAGLRQAVHQRAEAILAFVAAGPGTRLGPIKGCRVHTHSLLGTGGSFVRFTGRTKRDAIMQGTTLPYVGGEG